MEAILRRERTIIGGCLAIVVILSWLYLLDMAMTMPDMGGMAMPQVQEWSLVDLVLLFVMWAIMMVAMMVPSAAPMTLAFVSVNRRRQEAQRPLWPTGVFLLGYLLVWTVYSAIATLAQWGLHEAALLSPAMAATSPLLNGGLLVAAGAFQWTQWKRACLVGCRSPLTFLMSEWREGATGALIMGLRHGSYCVGCCWILMALLFVTGVMNLFWVGVITAFVMAEKIWTRGELLGRVAGVVLVGAGCSIIARSL